MNQLFKDYEKEALVLLLSRHFTRGETLELLERAEPMEVQYSGYGFFVTVSHPAFGLERRVCGGPVMVTATDNTAASFVAFLEGGELTLETFPLDGVNLPADFRDCDVRLSP